MTIAPDVIDQIGETEPLTRSESETLFAELRSWRDNEEQYCDAFRYEMFARRIVAAEHGRPDAVKWARDWLADIENQRQAAEAERNLIIEERHARLSKLREELAQGRSGNPRYQAYLDTVEDPTSISNNAGFMSWITARSTEYHALNGPAPIGLERNQQWHDGFTRYTRSYADTRLSSRVKAQRLALGHN